jgi:hypothetical protein
MPANPTKEDWTMCLSDECRHDTPAAPDGSPEFQQQIGQRDGRRYLICPACHWGHERVPGERTSRRKRACQGPGCDFVGALPGYDVDNAN